MNKIKKNITKASVYTIAFSSIFFVIYYLNYITPLCNDDYGYSFTLCEPLTRVTCIPQILMGLKQHYFIQGGRMFAHFFAQLMLMIGDLKFNLFNTVMYCLLIIGILLNSNVFLGSMVKKVFYIILAHILLFLYIPAFGESFLWLDGAVNYLWTNVVMLYALYPYFRLLHSYQVDKKRYYLFLPLFFFSGATNENTALANICIYIVIIFYVYKQKRKVPLWSKLGVFLAMVAYCTLIFAPGNYNRALLAKDYGIIINLIIRFAKTTYYFMDNEFVLIIITLFLITFKYIRESKAQYADYNENVYKRIKKRIVDSPMNFILIFAIFVSTYSMVAAPVQPARVFVYPSVLLIILLIRLVDENIACFPIGIRVCIIAALVCFYMTTSVNAFIDINKVNEQNNIIINEICEAKENGIDNVIVDPPAIPQTKYALRITLGEEVDYFYNIYYALFYGVETIQVKH